MTVSSEGFRRPGIPASCCLLGLAVALATPAASDEGVRIPLCQGLTLVTAIARPEGDYESIKTVVEADAGSVLLGYSAETVALDPAGRPTRKLQRFSMNRRVQVTDLRGSRVYLQQFMERLPTEVPGTTAIGTSAEVLRALRRGEQVELTVFEDLPWSDLSARPEVHPSVFDYRLSGSIRRVGEGLTEVPVTVNGELVSLPAVHARGDFYGDDAEFFFLDDPDNPLTLRFRLGIGGGSGFGERAALQVVRISSHCESRALAVGTEPAAGAALERALAESGRVEVYDIFFSFDSDQIRKESEPTLAQIAAVLGRRADWSVVIEGHTDSVASESYNLDLSSRRAEAVRRALTTRYGVDGARLATVGLGESSPRDTNDTLEGRARNRRVSLVLDR